ncbi:hypothetical protein IFO70_12710 [Phormidium tenue FACHB-886]|nr:hypothetical protein [Phormidium tenue FACHB-886]
MIEPIPPKPESDRYPSPTALPDPQLHRQIKRLHQRQVYKRWFTMGLGWLVLAPLCLWAVRDEIALMHDYFTWAALRYAIIYNRLPAFGLALCVAMTIATLIWQSRNILFGFSPQYENWLRQQALRSRKQ